MTPTEYRKTLKGACPDGLAWAKDEGVTSDQMFAMLCQLDKQRACLAASITSTQGEDRDTYKSVVSGRPINI